MKRIHIFRSDQGETTRRMSSGSRKRNGATALVIGLLVAGGATAGAVVGQPGRRRTARSMSERTHRPSGNRARAHPTREDRRTPRGRHDAAPTGIAGIEHVVSASRFADSYGGYVTGPDGVTSIYVTAAGMTALAKALSEASVSPSSYKLVQVAHSLAALEQLSEKIAGDQSASKSNGFDVVQWQPDPASNTVLAYIDDYSEARAQALQAEYGGPDWVTVKPWTGPQLLQPGVKRYR